jgi:aspartate ammonia-lyase
LSESLNDTRIERDALGEVPVPAEALWGIHTQRAIANFPVSGRTVRPELIRAMVQIKKACALAHKELRELDAAIADAIVSACDDVLAGNHTDAFVTDALQGGAGTSTHMNVNEVLANLALIRIGHRPGEYAFVHPIDHVNKGQSTNDVYPSALRIAAIARVRGLADALAALQDALQRKENEYADLKKLGRTQLMDAAPMTLGDSFGAYAQAIARDRWRIYKVEERLRQINLGGTAIGTGATASPDFACRVAEILRDITGMGLARAEYPMDLTQNNDVFVEVSGLLKACAVNLLKIGNDLRLLNSGPRGGIGEIRLQPRQMGSSIMPGKVNPVIPECIAQCAMRVIGHDAEITFAAASGQLELNAFLPLIADSLLDSLALFCKAVPLFRTACIETLAADPEACARHLAASTANALYLLPSLGYDAACELVKRKLHE